MDKYQLLLLLNVPLAAYGLFNILVAYKLKKLTPTKAFVRVLFWTTLLAGLVFSRQVSNLLYQRNLTDSPPLSIYDVVMVTGIMVGLSVVARAHGRIERLENRLTDLHEKLSIALSESHKK